MKVIERRFINTNELRASEAESMMIHGYPIVYDAETDIGPFRERVAVGAARDAIKSDDIFLLLNHDSNFPLARTANGTVIPGEDEHGVFMDADLSKSNHGPGAAKDVREKLITGMSFQFEVEEEEWKKEDKKKDLRTITKFKRIYDFSLVTFPAYKKAEVQARCAEDIFRSHSEAMAPDETTVVADEDHGPENERLFLETELIILGVEK